MNQSFRIVVGAGSGVVVNTADGEALMSRVASCLDVGEGFAIATLNLDHIVKLRRDPSFVEAYRRQDIVVADGNPVVWLSRLAGRPVDLVPGADMVVPLARLAADRRVPVALLGSTDEALARAASHLEEVVPGLAVAARLAPSAAFDPEGPEADLMIEALLRSGAGLVFLALGAPKQESFAARCRRELPNVGFASIGAGLDFLAGKQRRAPSWMRRAALEWLWRLASQPRRLAARYGRCALLLPGLGLQALALRYWGPLLAMDGAADGRLPDLPLSAAPVQLAHVRRMRGAAAEAWRLRELELKSAS